jgi:hypothetical protein
MTKKNWLLFFIALVLAGVYVFYFTSAFQPKNIHITHTSRVIGGRRTVRASNNPGFLARLSRLANSAAVADSTTLPITFILERPYKFTELKVVDLDEWQTNKNCLPLWHLVADTNSAPINPQFRYGENIHGMKPAVPGARAQPLQPGVKYRLLVTDGSAKGQHDFQPVAKPATPTAASP